MAWYDFRHSTTPILRLQDEGNGKFLPLQVLGSGFYVGRGPTLVTAKHVFDGIDFDHDNVGFLMFEGDIPRGGDAPQSKIRLNRIKAVQKNSRYDIASVKVNVPDMSEIKITPLPLWRSKIALTDDVIAYEYSDSARSINPQGVSIMDFRPRCHKGNVVASAEQLPPFVDYPVYVTSFPALQGASGAPLMRHPDFGIAGMLIANLEQELMPAQVVSIREGKHYSEETKYFLPYGVAIQSSILIEHLCEVGDEPQLTDYPPDPNTV